MYFYYLIIRLGIYALALKKRDYYQKKHLIYSDISLDNWPKRIIILLPGLFTVYQIIIQKYSFNKYLVAILLYMIVLIHSIENFII